MSLQSTWWGCLDEARWSMTIELTSRQLAYINLYINLLAWFIWTSTFEVNHLAKPSNVWSLISFSFFKCLLQL